MAARARGRGSRYGIDSPVLETSLGSTGTVLETATPEAGRRKAKVGNVASGAGAIEPRAAGRKKDFRDAERLVKRLVARELTLSFVPDAEQRLWRTVTRRKYQLKRDRVRLQNQLESLLEEAHIKLSSLVSFLARNPYFAKKFEWAIRDFKDLAGPGLVCDGQAQTIVVAVSGDRVEDCA